KLQLESKFEAKSKGHPSPDRADALTLCFSNYKIEKAIKEPVTQEEKIGSSLRKEGFRLDRSRSWAKFTNREAKYQDVNRSLQDIRKSNKDHLRYKIEEYNSTIR